MEAEKVRPKVTVTRPGELADKIKNPKRVAQGKRLAQVSVQAKAIKKAEREQAEAISKQGSYTPYFLAAGAALAAVASYFAYTKLTKQTPSKTEQTPSKTEQTPSKTEQTPSRTEQPPSKTKETPGRKPNFVVF